MLHLRIWIHILELFLETLFFQIYLSATDFFRIKLYRTFKTSLTIQGNYY